jgi:hypothetical protein
MIHQYDHCGERDSEDTPINPVESDPRETRTNEVTKSVPNTSFVTATSVKLVWSEELQHDTWRLSETIADEAEERATRNEAIKATARMMMNIASL